MGDKIVRIEKEAMNISGLLALEQTLDVMHWKLEIHQDDAVKYLRAYKWFGPNEVFKPDKMRRETDHQ